MFCLYVFPLGTHTLTAWVAHEVSSDFRPTSQATRGEEGGWGTQSVYLNCTLLERKKKITLVKEAFLCNRWKPSQRTTTNQNAEFGSSDPGDASTSTLTAQGTLQMTEQKDGKARTSEVCCETIPMVMPQAAPTKSHLTITWTKITSWTCQSGWRQLTRPPLHTKGCRHLREAESRRNSLPQGRAHQLVIHYQVVRPQNKHTR